MAHVNLPVKLGSGFPKIALSALGTNLPLKICGKVLYKFHLHIGLCLFAFTKKPEVAAAGGRSEARSHIHLTFGEECGAINNGGCHIRYTITKTIIHIL